MSGQSVICDHIYGKVRDSLSIFNTHKSAVFLNSKFLNPFLLIFKSKECREGALREEGGKISLDP